MPIPVTLPGRAMVDLLPGKEPPAQRGSRASAIALGLAVAALAACGSGTPVTRGFGSREILQIRDTTFSFTGWGINTIDYSTSDDGGYMNRTVQIQPGPAPDQTFPEAGVVDASVVLGNLYTCEPVFDSQGNLSTVSITDVQTGQETTVGDISVLVQCPYDDPTLTILRTDASGALSLWSGPFDALQQIPVSVTLDQYVDVIGGGTDASGNVTDSSVVVLASPAAQPGAIGLFSIDLTTYVVTPLVPPALGTAAWASGATATTGALSSSSLWLPPNPYWGLVSPIGSQYGYERAMADGSTIMFAGTFPSGPASELALFAVAPSSNVSSYIPQIADQAIWQYQDNQGLFLYVWDGRHQQFVSCPLPASIGEAGSSTTDGTKTLLGATPPSSFDDSGGSNSPLVVISFPTASQIDAGAGGGGCALLAPANVAYAGFAADGSQIFWMVRPATGDPVLWTAAADGSGARMIGSGAITQPHYAVGTELEFELGGDLVWVDTTDSSNKLHYVAEQIFGSAVDFGLSWVVIGYDFNTQDGTGILGVVNRDTGAKRLISPEVAQFELSGLIAYLVRGRNPSSQDGVWVATVSPSDLQ
jgi:hypothetical protein